MSDSFRTRVTRPLITASIAVALVIAISGRSRSDDAPQVDGPQVPVRSSVLAGMASLDITPDLRRMPVTLNGYGGRAREKAEGVHDPIFARALVLSDDDGHLAAIVSVDLCYVTTVVRNRVLQELGDEGFTDSRFILAATHNHSGFAGYDASFVARLAMGRYRESTLQFLVDAIVEAVRSARDEMRPARLGYVAQEVQGLNRSRLDPGFVHGDEKANAPTDPVAHPVERLMTVLKVEDLGGRTIGAIVHFTAHPTVLSPDNMLISADYPGVIYRRVEEEMGPGTVTMFLNGPLGDAAPNPDWDENMDGFTQMEEYGEDVSDAAIGLLRKTEPLAIDGVEGAVIREDFNRVYLRAMTSKEMPLFLSKAFYTDPEVAFDVVRVGPLYWFAVPGEPTYATGRNYQTLCPQGGHCLVVAPSNAYMGYLVTTAQYQVDGYESDSCYYGPEAANRVQAELRRAIDELHRK